MSIEANYILGAIAIGIGATLVMDLMESVPEAYVQHCIAQLLFARTLASPHAGGHF